MSRHGSKGELLMLSVHVDDQLIACNNRQELDQFKLLSMQNLNALTQDRRDISLVSISIGIDKPESFTCRKNTTLRPYLIALT